MYKIAYFCVMKQNYLLPYKFKALGLVLFIVGFILGPIIYLNQIQPEFFRINVLSIIQFDPHTNERFFKFLIIKNNIIDEIVLIIFLVGGLLLGFTKEKNEDEFISQLRSNSLIWAVVLNTFVLILVTMFVYDINYLDMMIYNMGTPLIVFIFRFNYLKFINRTHEE